MIKYQLISHGKHTIVEIDTDQVISEHKDIREAGDQYLKLIHGAGFDGWTPSFVARSVKPFIEQHFEAA